MFGSHGIVLDDSLSFCGALISVMFFVWLLQSSFKRKCPKQNLLEQSFFGKK